MCTSCNSNFNLDNGICKSLLDGYVAGYGVHCGEICGKVGKNCDMAPLYSMTSAWCGENYDQVQRVPGEDPNCGHSGDWLETCDGSPAIGGGYPLDGSPCVIEGNGRLWYNQDHESGQPMYCNDGIYGYAWQVCYCV